MRQHRGGRAPRRKTVVSAAERAVGYSILAALCAVAIFVLAQQQRFNPAVLVALREGPLPGQPREDSSLPVSGAAALIPKGFAAFTPLSDIETFSPDNLSDKIDGKAELYLSSGFKEMACRSFALGPASASRVEISVYEMSSPRGAYAVYSGQRRAGSEPSVLARNSYFTGNALFFASGSFYVEIIADEASEAVKNAIEQIGGKMIELLPPETGKLEETALFPQGGLSPESVRLAATDAFGLEGFNDVFTAEYRSESGEASAFLSIRPTAEDAAARARSYLKFLADNGYLEVSAEGAPSGATVLSLDGSFEVVMVNGPILAGVHDATSLQAALELARDLEAQLRKSQR